MFVGVGVGVCVFVGVGVFVFVGVLVFVGVGVFVFTGVGVLQRRCCIQHPFAANAREVPLKKDYSHIAGVLNGLFF